MFAEAFPTIQSATVDVVELDYSDEWPTHMTHETCRPFVDCSNAGCYHGIVVGEHLALLATSHLVV